MLNMITGGRGQFCVFGIGLDTKAYGVLNRAKQ